MKIIERFSLNRMKIVQWITTIPPIITTSHPTLRFLEWKIFFHHQNLIRNTIFPVIFECTFWIKMDRFNRHFWPVIVNLWLQSLFANARANFALIFEELLEYLTSMIGEHRSSVYFQLVLLEYALFDWKRLSKMQEEIIDTSRMTMTRWSTHIRRRRLGPDNCRFDVRYSLARRRFLFDFVGKISFNDDKTINEEGEDLEMRSSSSSNCEASSDAEEESDNEDAIEGKGREKNGDKKKKRHERRSFYETEVLLPMIFWRYW